ncbi:hypothetical protein KEM48_011897 [Puccinia striiformis f. sp. tritici PST-130]|nr:hypothetical protein KEM48_011897 [Puccinia striiformis f. sp. tritici PST-130]
MGAHLSTHVTGTRQHHEGHGVILQHLLFLSAGNVVVLGWIIHRKMVASSIMINDDSETKLGGPDNHALGIAVVFESLMGNDTSPRLSFH